MGNNLNINAEINKIVAPELSQAGYGAGINKVFEQIDANFKILGNRNFVKGDRGWSIGYKEVHITYSKEVVEGNETHNETYFTKEGINVLNAIIGEITDQRYEYQDDDEHQNIETVKTWLDTIDALKSVTKVVDGVDHKISLIDSIVPGDLFNEIYVYDPTNPDNSYTIGATNDYVFKDSRFVVGMDNYDEIYSSLYDCSCTVHFQVYENTDTKELVEKFVIIHNTPTLYFDTNLQTFCWRIGGHNTGLIAQGPKGEKGISSAFYIVKVERGEEVPVSDGVRKIVEYMDGNNWKSVDDGVPSDFKNSNCIAFEPINGGVEYSPASYFGIITMNDDNVYVVSCTANNRIQTNLNLEWLAGSFSSIRVDRALKGLFVPIKEPVKEPGIDETLDNTPVHAIWHAAERDSKNIFYELHVSPMSTYAGIGRAAKQLEDISKNVSSRLSSYNELIYSDASLVFDYNSVIFSGHPNMRQTGVRIGIGTNDISDSVGFNSLVRFGANSKVHMPGGASSASIEGTLSVTGNTSLGATTINGAATVTDTLKVGNTATAKVNKISNVYLGCPIGTVVMWAGSMESDEANIPEGWLLCDGSEILIDLINYIPIWEQAVTIGGKVFNNEIELTELGRLVQVIGSKWGVVPHPHDSGKAYWKLPDLQQRFPLGASKGSDGFLNNGFDSNDAQITVNTSLGEHDGSSEVTLSERTMPEHTHDIYAQDSTGGNTANTFEYDTSYSTKITIQSNPKGGSRPHSNMPPYLAINFIIKYK